MLIKILILVILIAIKALFSASDTAFTYINKSRISQLSKRDGKAKKIKYFMEEKNKFYGIIEVVITLMELLASAYVTETFLGDLIAQLATMNITGNTAIILATAIITIILSYLMLIFGGILPKQVARNHPEKTANTFISILWIVAKLNYPFEWLVNTSTKLFAKIFNIKENPKEHLTEKEIKMIIAEGKDQGVIDEIEQQIVLKALKFDNILVKTIMVKKEHVDFINILDNKKQILNNIRKHHYTRMPVYEDNENNVIGLLNIKDLIIDYAQDEEIELDLKKHLREILTVNKSERISHVFKTMQTKNIPMAVVLDEENKVIGMVTLEDILEKLVGKIFDEFDKVENEE